MNHLKSPDTRSFSVLFVDDDPSMRYLARHFVEKTGDIILEEASSGQEALEKFEKGGYDAVVSDYEMPGMNGLELLIRIRERDRDFPFIILTGKRRDEIVVPVINHGVSFYIQKGIDNESQFYELWHVIREAIDHHRARIRLEESETRFRLLAERSQDMIYRMKLPEGTYEYVSPSSAEITGFTPQEFYDHPLLVFERIHPECRDYLSRCWNGLTRGSMPATYEFKFFHKSGEIRWCRQRNTLIRNEEGKPIAIEGSVSDVTEENLAKAELARNEMMYRSMAESAQDIIFILDRDGIVRT
jgi:PAS domain S-box-containing protein